MNGGIANNYCTANSDNKHRSTTTTVKKTSLTYQKRNDQWVSI